MVKALDECASDSSFRLFDGDDEAELEACGPSYAAAVATRTNPEPASSSALAGSSHASLAHSVCSSCTV